MRPRIAPAGFTGRPATWAGLGLALVVCLVFARAVTCGFVNYGDPWFVSENERIQQGVTWENLRWALTTGEMGYYKPVTVLSWMLDTTLFGSAPCGYHLTNVLLHAAGACALFLALRTMTGSLGPSLAAAAIWALHPLRVESVAWISQRKDVLSALFGFCALWAYGVYARDGRTRAMVAAACLLFLSLLSKPMLVTFPALLLLVDIWPLGRIHGPLFSRDRRGEPLGAVLAEKIPFALLAALAVGWLVWPGGEAGELAPIERPPPWDHRLANAGVSYARYFGKHLFFDELAMIYPRRDWPLGIVIQCYGFLLTLGALVLALARRWPQLAVAWLWFLGALVPVLQLRPFGNFAMADRFTYIPSAGLIAGVVFALHAAFLEPARGPARRRAVGVGIVAISAILSVATVRQIGVWRNSRTLFQHTLEVTGANAIAMTNLGAHFLERGRPYPALAWYRRRVDMGFAADRLPTLAKIHYRLGHKVTAGALLEARLAARPESARSWRRLARLHLEFRHVDRATRFLGRAVAIAPRSAANWRVLGEALAEAGRGRAALAVLRRAAALAPEDGAVRARVADLIAERNPAAAGPWFAAAAAVAPDDPSVRLRHGLYRFRRGEDRAALGELRAATEGGPSPQRARAHRLLGRVYERLGEIRKAIAHWRRALELGPASASAHNELGALLGRTGRLEAAIEHFRQAVRLDPQYQPARENLEKARDIRASQ